MAASKIVYLEWYDACGKTGWCAPEHVAPPVHIKSIGYIVAENKEFISISPGWDYVNAHFMSFVTIPKGWIRKRKVIRV